jgi:hypothetical protein
MLKKTVFSAVVIAMLSCVAMATIPTIPTGFKLQEQDFSIGSLNMVSLIGSGGTASNMNTATIFQNQQDRLICSWANENQVVTFIQDGGVGAVCGGAWLIGQEALVGGGQMQLIGDGCGPKVETQGLVAQLGQAVTKIDGTGAATAIHSLGLVQTQSAGNSAGIMSETNAVAAGQYSVVAGGPSTTGQVTAGLTVGTNQTQVDM